MTSLRARVRSELTEEIKAVARRHLATDGANLSLRAVTRELGMASSAVYRYFPSRDHLLTALIIDAYNDLGACAEAAEAAVGRADLRGRWLATTEAIRGWAVAHRAEYALLYGSPVPGYAAPPDTIEPANRPVLLLVGILRDAHAAGRIGVADVERLPRATRAELRPITAQPAFAGIPEAVFARGMLVWAQVFGAISFELFGRLQNVIEAHEDYFRYQMTAMAAYLRL